MNNKNLFLNVSACVGCGACVVACMDQNDIYPEDGKPALRRIYQLEDGLFPNATIQYLSVGCYHCEESPCVTGCPTGAIAKESSGCVTVNKDLCIGCHSCAMACPFGTPRYDNDDKLQKCDLCSVRVSEGYKPACVRVCPFDALKYEDPNAIQSDREYEQVKNLANAVQRTII